ncbi:hypothetical protein OsI_08061 [Oryza sativa Indica Group]|uniref:Uncharacterized protein n=1 Tax=Oryza sativa subsp. indica TaxID=39946 RepID=A2X768_ORYSI|nr:hypothetical protein OsI_08061 [Oryza sativa Indica Group]
MTWGWLGDVMWWWRLPSQPWQQGGGVGLGVAQERPGTGQLTSETAVRSHKTAQLGNGGEERDGGEVTPFPLPPDPRIIPSLPTVSTSMMMWSIKRHSDELIADIHVIEWVQLSDPSSVAHRIDHHHQHPSSHKTAQLGNGGEERDGGEVTPFPLPPDPRIIPSLPTVSTSMMMWSIKRHSDELIADIHVIEWVQLSDPSSVAHRIDHHHQHPSFLCNHCGARGT